MRLHSSILRRRVFASSEMISQISSSPLIYLPFHWGKPVLVQFPPCFVSLNFRCFPTSPFYCKPNLRQVSSVAAGAMTTRSHPTSTSAANRISRVMKNEAQEALFDYLHCTRSFHFMDAEHISKNSPLFLQKLLSVLDDEQDIARSLSRFFRYNPINEFEPFLESLGLAPSEFSSLLPRKLMFLSDDHLMLDNFHALCDYGIPRSKIGKIYKEAMEVFGHDFGILASKLKSYEELGLSKSMVIKLVSCSPSLLIGGGVNSEFVRLLEKLRKLGIRNDWIKGHVTSRSVHNWHRLLDTIEFLDRIGYGDEDIRALFETNPSLFFEGSGKKIYVMVGLLLKLGLKMNEVFLLFSGNPQVLSEKFFENLKQAVCFLFDIRMGTEDIAHIVSLHIQLMGSHSLRAPITVLRKLKIRRDRLCQIICEDPLELFNLASKSNGEQTATGGGHDAGKCLEKTAFLSKLGYTENSEEMMKALKKFRGRGDQLQERFDCLVQAGLDCNVVANMIKQAPSVLNQTKDVIEKKIDCLRNCLGYPLESVAAFPTFLCYDLERINLRFSMYAWLRERGAAKQQLSLSTLLACSDARFVKYFVAIHPEGPAMWERLKKLSS